MSQFHVDSEAIQQAAGSVNNSIADIRQAVQRMYVNLENLNNSWHGSAANQFQSLTQQWHGAQQQMENSLASIQQALTQASQLYADAESQASRLFSY